MPRTIHAANRQYRAAPGRAPILVPALVILLALLLRIAMLGIDVRFHPDEALFAAQARLINQQHDWLLRTTDLDKPPLTFCVTALSFGVLPESEFAARLPNVLFSGLSVALLYGLGRILYRDRIAPLVAILLFALSPYDLAFAATTFTDVQATTWVLAACLLAVSDRWTGAGLATALTLAAKPTALLFVPLVLALGIAYNARESWHLRDLWWRLRAFALPLLAGIALLLAWDTARSPRSFFELGYTRNNPGRLIRSDELWPRAEQWLHWLGFGTGSRWLNLAATGLIPLHLVRHLRSRTHGMLADRLIAGFAAAFLGWYWLVAFNTYDRYIHTLIPFVLLLLARGLVGLWQMARAHWIGLVVLLALAITIVPALATTLHGDAPLGGDQGRHSGIDRLATYLNSELAGMTVYDHWLGWELTYYLGPAPRVTLHYLPLPDALVDAMRAATSTHYFVAPSPGTTALWLDALDRADIATTPVYQDARNGFVVYRLTPPSQ